MSEFKPTKLILHDYGGTPQNRDGVFNPYHTLVFPDGSVRYRDPANPYKGRAPHAFKSNNDSIGLSYAGPVGSTPTPAAMSSLTKEFTNIRSMFPGIKHMGHGEAYQQTRGTPQQASRDGRDLNEASWRSNLGGPSAPTQAEPSRPSLLSGAQFNTDGITTSARVAPPVAARGFTAFAGAAQRPEQAAGLGSARPAIMQAPNNDPVEHGNERQMQERPQLMQQSMDFTPLPENIALPAHTPQKMAAGVGAGWRDQPPMAQAPPTTPAAAAMQAEKKTPEWTSAPRGIRWKSGEFTSLESH
jgi:hypothetical protein